MGMAFHGEGTSALGTLCTSDGLRRGTPVLFWATNGPSLGDGGLKEGRRAWIGTGLPSGHLTGRLELAVVADADKGRQLYCLCYFTSCSRQL